MDLRTTYIKRSPDTVSMLFVSYLKYKLLVHETCLQRHHLIANDRNHQKANAIPVSRIRMHLKSIILNPKNALFPIPPIQPIDTKLLGKSKVSKVHSQSQVGLHMFSEQSGIE